MLELRSGITSFRGSCQSLVRVSAISAGGYSMGIDIGIGNERSNPTCELAWSLRFLGDLVLSSLRSYSYSSLENTLMAI